MHLRRSSRAVSTTGFRAFSYTALTLSLLLVVTACSPLAGQGAATPSPTGGGPTNRGVLVPGIINFHGDESTGVITAPDTAQAGQDYTLTVTTFGGGCEEAGETSVAVTSDGATLWVYDFTTATGTSVVCTAILKRLPHRVTLRFDRPGEALIRVWGRRVAAGTPPTGVPLVLEHRVVVR